MDGLHQWRVRPSRAAWLSVLVLAAASVLGPAGAAPSAKDLYRAGVVCGQVVDAKSGKPVAGATVALQNRKGQVIAWTVTGANGQYRLGAPCLNALDLNGHHRGMLASIGRGFVQVVQLPVKAVGVAAGAVGNTLTTTVKAVNPVGTIKAAAIAAAEGNPLALAGQAATDMQNLMGAKTQQAARANAAQAVVGAPGIAKPKPKAKPAAPVPQPGDAVLLVGAPQYKSFQGIAGAYWMQPPLEGKKTLPVGPQAWLDTVQLAPNSDAKAASVTQDQAETLAAPTLTPAFAAAGSPVKITVQLQGPPEPAGQVCVVAREEKTGQAVALTPQAGGLYAGTLTLDPKTPVGPTTVTIAALNAAPMNIKLRSGKDAQKSYLDWAGHLDCLDATRPYRFDPRFMASQNRLDLQMMVLNPALETPPPPTPPTPPAPATPATPAPTPTPATPAPSSVHPAGP